MVNDKRIIIQSIVELLPAMPFPVLEFVYWYMIS